MHKAEAGGGQGARDAVRVVLQAGGRGERLRPATDHTPKPLLPVAGVPMVERLFRQLLAGGARDFTVITGWLGEQIQAHLTGLPGLPADLRFHFLQEATPLGNAGALRLVPEGEGPVLLCFGDLVTDLDYGKLLAIHRERGAAVTLTSHTESLRLRLGELLVEGDTVTGYLEKPEKHFLICSGIAVFEPAVLQLIPPDRPTGLVDVIMAALGAGFEVTHWVHGAFWRDVNSSEALAEADAALRAMDQGR